MIRLKQAIIVEGRYDKIRLSSLVDTVIIPTNGFGLYKDRETAELIKAMAKKAGIIILTDSDSAGFQIRSHIKNIVKEGEVINCYIPDIYGKERRKNEPSKEGKLGVEGMTSEALVEAFRRAGVLAAEVPEREKDITKADLMELGYIGEENSAERRRELQRRLGLPERLSANMLLELLNVNYTLEEFKQLATGER